MANVFTSLFEIFAQIFVYGWVLILAIFVVYKVLQGLFWCLTWVVVKVVTKDLDIDLHKDEDRL